MINVKFLVNLEPSDAEDALLMLNDFVLEFDTEKKVITSLKVIEKYFYYFYYFLHYCAKLFYFCLVQHSEVTLWVWWEKLN